MHAVRPEALAADAVDEAFARAFVRWDRVRTLRSPAGWVYRVAVNEARRQLRRATREDVLLASIGPPSPAPPPGNESWLLVEELPVRQRAAVVLRHVAGLTEAEVGKALGVTRSTVSSSLAAAYRTLAGKLADEHDEGSTGAPVRLAVARRCWTDGCNVEWLSRTEPVVRASYSAAMQDTIKVRPGDLVAVDPSGPTVVWRWWSGTVEEVGGGRAEVSRNVTRPGPDDPRRATFRVELPDDLVAAVEAGNTIWFGPDAEGRKVAVAMAVAGSPTIRQGIG